MNRAQRRAAQRQVPGYKRHMTDEERLRAVYKNGITADDLEDSYREGCATHAATACGYATRRRCWRFVSLRATTRSATRAFCA